MVYILCIVGVSKADHFYIIEINRCPESDYKIVCT